METKLNNDYVCHHFGIVPEKNCPCHYFDDNKKKAIKQAKAWLMEKGIK